MGHRNDSHEIETEDVLDDALAGAPEGFEERAAGEDAAERSHVHIQRPNALHE